MTKYLFDLVAYRYWQGERVETKRETIQIDNFDKGIAMGKAIACFVEEDKPEDFITVEITTARVGDATR